MRLSVVIPVRDDAAGLVRILGDLQTTGVAAEVIVVDDASDPPCRLAVAAGSLPQGLPLVWLRSDAGLGAGGARNLGLDAARGSHVLFLDADDRVTAELPLLVRALARREFDFALFCHDDSRRLARGQNGPDEALDRALWAQVDPGPDPRLLDPAGARVMCRISNYPWNRIWRRDFLLSEGIRHGAMPLHNDIEPHWVGFIAARRILCSDRRCVVHVVDPARGQLTNRRDAARLRLFEALDAVVALMSGAVAQRPDCAGFAGPFLDFSLRLLDWVAEIRTDPADVAMLRERAGRFLAGFAVSADPALAGAVEQALADEPGLAGRFLHWAGGAT